MADGGDDFRGFGFNGGERGGQAVEQLTAIEWLSVVGPEGLDF